MGVGTNSLGALNSFIFFFLFFFSSLLASHYHCAEVDEITPLKPLAQGQTLVSSPGHIFELGFFSPNNSTNKYVGIWHKNIFPRKVVWVANREKPLAATDTSAILTVSSNGNLKLVDGKQKSVWSTNVTSQVSSSSNTSSVAAILLDNGNLIVNDYIGAELWKSFDYPGDTVLPNMVLRYDKSGKGSFLSSWKSENDRSYNNANTSNVSIRRISTIKSTFNQPSDEGYQHTTHEGVGAAMGLS